MARILEKSGTNLRTEAIEEKNVYKKPVETEPQTVSETVRSGGIKKEYMKDKNLCRVTFTLPKEATNGSEKVSIVGDFNNWDSHANPMEKSKYGDFVTVCDLEPGKEFQFRYLIDGSIWENDWYADRYVKSCYGDCDNSVVIT